MSSIDRFMNWRTFAGRNREHLSQTITNLRRMKKSSIQNWLIILTKELVAVTKLGPNQARRAREFSPWRTYKSKSIKFAKLKNEDDQIILPSPIKLDDVMYW